MNSERLRPLFNSIKSLFKGVAATHVLRGGNADADLLANLSQDALEVALGLMDCKAEGSASTREWLTDQSLERTEDKWLLPELLVEKIAAKQSSLISALQISQIQSGSNAIPEASRPQSSNAAFTEETSSSSSSPSSSASRAPRAKMRASSAPKSLPGATIVIDGELHPIDLSREMRVLPGDPDSGKGAARLRGGVSEESPRALASMAQADVLLARLMVHFIRRLVSLLHCRILE